MRSCDCLSEQVHKLVNIDGHFGIRAGEPLRPVICPQLQLFFLHGLLR